MPKYRLTGGRHGDATRGDIVELSERQYRILSTKFVPIDDSSSDDGDDESDANTDSSSEFDAESFVTRNVPKVRDDIENGAADGHFDAVREAEEGHRDRKSIKQALDERASDI